MLLYIFVSLCNNLMMTTHSGPKLFAKNNTIIKLRIVCGWKYLYIYIFNRKLQSLSSREKLEKHLPIRDADKSLARPGRVQASAKKDFDVHTSYLLS